MPTPDGQPPHEGARDSREAAEQQIRERDARDEREQRNGDRPGAIAHSLDDQARAVPVREGKRDANDEPRQRRDEQETPRRSPFALFVRDSPTSTRPTANRPTSSHRRRRGQ